MKNTIDKLWFNDFIESFALDKEYDLFQAYTELFKKYIMYFIEKFQQIPKNLYCTTNFSDYNAIKLEK